MKVTKKNVEKLINQYGEHRVRQALYAIDFMQYMIQYIMEYDELSGDEVIRNILWDGFVNNILYPVDQILIHQKRYIKEKEEDKWMHYSERDLDILYKLLPELDKPYDKRDKKKIIKLFNSIVALDRLKIKAGKK